MKYVRLTNKIYEIEKEDCDSYFIKGHPNMRWVLKEQFKASDNIEDLFDLNVIVTSDGKHHIENGLGIINIDLFNKSGDKAYGCIWTDWGLKYVAKLNEKGQWELT